MCEEVSRIYKGFITEHSFKMFIEKRYEFCKNNKLPPKKVIISQDVYFDFIYSGHIYPNDEHIKGIPYKVVEYSNIENYIKIE